MIRVSKFFLKRISTQGSKFKLSCYFFGYVNATRNIPDYLLHDYFVEFFGCIIEDHLELMKVKPKRLTPKKFRKIAKAKGNTVAIKFIDFYDKKLKDLKEQDEKIDFLYRIRDISTHRKFTTQPNFMILENNKWNFGLEDRTEKKCIIIEDGIGFCEHCLDRMKAFVKEVKNYTMGKWMLVGTVIHYYTKIGVAIIDLSNSLVLGDRISIEGFTTDLKQTVDSMQIEHKNVEKATKGDIIGVKVEGRCRKGDKVRRAEYISHHTS